MGKFVIILTHGKENLERASLAWSLANAAISLDAEVVIFLQIEAVFLVQKDYCNGLVSPPYIPIEELITMFQEFGGKIYACAPCVEARQISHDSFIDGVEVAGAVTLFTEATDAASVLTY